MTDNPIDLARAQRRKRMKGQDFASYVKIALDEIGEVHSGQITLSCKRCGSQQFRMILRGNKVIGLCTVSDCEGGVVVEFWL